MKELLPLVLFAPLCVSAAGTARITIDADHVIAAVDPRITGTATVTQILSDDLTNQPCAYEARDTYAPKVSEVPAKGATLHFSSPAHSFTQIVVGVDR